MRGRGPIYPYAEISVACLMLIASLVLLGLVCAG